MRLLFDHNLSHKLVQRLADCFPGSTQTRLIGLAQAPDQAIWDHALQHGFCIVTLDADSPTSASCAASLPRSSGSAAAMPPSPKWNRCCAAICPELPGSQKIRTPAIWKSGREPTLG